METLSPQKSRETRECAAADRNRPDQGKATFQPRLPARGDAGARSTTGFAAILSSDAESVDDTGRPVRRGTGSARHWRLCGRLPVIDRVILAYVQDRLKPGRHYHLREIKQIVGCHFRDAETIQIDLALLRAPFRLVNSGPFEKRYHIRPWPFVEGYEPEMDTDH